MLGQFEWKNNCSLFYAGLSSPNLVCHHFFIQAEMWFLLKVLKTSIRKQNIQKCHSCLFSGWFAFCAQLGACWIEIWRFKCKLTFLWFLKFCSSIGSTYVFQNTHNCNFLLLSVFSVFDMSCFKTVWNKNRQHLPLWTNILVFCSCF